MKKLLIVTLLTVASSASAQTVGFVRTGHSWNQLEHPTMDIERVSFTEFAVGVGARYEALDLMVGAGLQYVQPYALGGLFFLQGRHWLSQGSLGSSVFIEQGWHSSNSQWSETSLYTALGASLGVSIGGGYLNFEPAVRLRYQGDIQPVIGISLSSASEE